MTRINCCSPQDLSRQHLIAEYRELPRIFGLVKAAIIRGEKPNDPRNPTSYTLGKGHCRFFYPRLQYLVDRQRSLIAEMRTRGYAPTFDEGTISELTTGIPRDWMGEWQPDAVAVAINIARILERNAGIKG
jgi:deoxyribonuclease (pyrimidine dimer)